MAQTGKVRKRNSRKQLVEAPATGRSGRPVSWDRPWEPTPERKAQEREWERRRLERLDLDLVDTAQDLVDLKNRADAEEQKVAHLQRLLDRKRELLTEISRIQQARTEAEKETRAGGAPTGVRAATVRAARPASERPPGWSPGQGRCRRRCLGGAAARCRRAGHVPDLDHGSTA